MFTSLQSFGLFRSFKFKFSPECDARTQDTPSRGKPVTGTVLQCHCLCDDEPHSFLSQTAATAVAVGCDGSLQWDRMCARWLTLKLRHDEALDVTSMCCGTSELLHK
jgi:hypothetical protein